MRLYQFIAAAAVLVWASSAQAACPTNSGFLGGGPGSTAASLATQTADQVNITGGCITGLANLNGITTVSGSDLSGGGSLYLGNELLSASVTGNENTFLGTRAGGAFNGTSSFNLAIGHNACGIGAGAPFASNSNMCLGTDAGRNLASAATGEVIIGAGAGQNVTGVRNTIVGQNAATTALTSGFQNTILGQNAGGTLGTGAGNVIIGFNSAATASAVAGSVIIGGEQSGGGAGARGASQSVIIGRGGGNASLTGANSILIGAQIGQTNCTSGGNVIEIFTAAGDCSAAAAANEIQIGTGATAWLKVTGTNAVTTAVPTIHGLPVLPDVTTGTPAASLCLDASNNIVKKTTTGACI